MRYVETARLTPTGLRGEGDLLLAASRSLQALALPVHWWPRLRLNAKCGRLTPGGRPRVGVVSGRGLLGHRHGGGRCLPAWRDAQDRLGLGKHGLGSCARPAQASDGRALRLRQAQWWALQETVGPLIRGLAAGSSDPGDAGVRTQCAEEAARLRRLMAESDDSATPLLHELYASVAERRGVAVDIEVAGLLPDVPSSVRRTVTDIVIEVLAMARGHARITITAGADAVVVSLVAHSTAPLQLPALPGDAGSPVVVDVQDDDGDLWVEARWTVR